MMPMNAMAVVRVAECVCACTTHASAAICMLEPTLEIVTLAISPIMMSGASTCTGKELFCDDFEHDDVAAGGWTELNGAVSTSRLGPRSTMRPPYMTAMESQACATTPRSCVTRMIVCPASASWRRSAMTSAPTASLHEAFARSCNTAFVELGLRLGVDAVRSAAGSFGFDSDPDPIPLQVAESTVGPIPDRAALAMTSIGQKDVSVTPLQNALIAATIANNGVMMRPFLVSSLKAPDLANLATTIPIQQRRAVSPQVATKLRDLMVAAEQNTQQKGAIPGVQIASKTGTAEHGTDPRNTPPHAWYIAFAPAQAPKVAVAVLVENGGDRLSATGGAVAAPIGRAVIAAALQEGS